MRHTLWLLTHSTELTKASNTGHLLALADVEIAVKTILWSRVAPDPALIAALMQPSVLVYPSAQAITLDVTAPQLSLDDFSQIVVLDATWQLARKMFNQSPYLQQIPAIQLVGAAPSSYQLRRNQQQLGWCTAEIGIQLLNLLGKPSANLVDLYQQFNVR